MKNVIQKEIKSLIEAGVIDDATAERIAQYYAGKNESSSSRILIVFGILGSILAGLGIVMLLAHNWDELPRFIKTMIAFLPMLVGQVLTFYGYYTKRSAWLEGAATFLFLGTIACISLIAQIYHISGGDFADFILAIFLLNLPLVYLCRAKSTALLCVAAITAHGWAMGYEHEKPPYFYWLGLLALAPHVIRLYRENAKSNFYRGMLWAMALSITTCFGTLFIHVSEDMIVLAYFYAALLFSSLATFPLFEHERLWGNPLKVLGGMGYLLFFFAFTFGGFWDDLVRVNQMEFSHWVIIIGLIVGGIAANALNGFKNWYYTVLIVLSLMALLASSSSVGVAVAVSNIAVLFISVYHIVRGHREDHLGILNVGLLTLLALISMRYFDWNLSFIVKGIIFILLGIGFFVANYVFVKNRKAKQRHE